MTIHDIIRKALPNSLPLVALVLSTALSNAALADAKDDDFSVTSSNPRIKVLNYNESEVYLIRTKYGYQTNIIFDPKEEIKTISVGDRSLWQIIPSGNRLFIRPMTDNLSTNMSLLTTKRSYEFELRSVSENNQGNIYVARFNYPETARQASGITDDARFESATAAHTIFNSPAIQSDNLPPPVATQSAASEQHVLKLPQTTSDKKSSSSVKKANPAPAASNNYDYTYTGPDEIAPIQVYDNGKSTFVKYKSIKKPAPKAFMIDSNGKEKLLSSSVKGSSLIVNAVAGELILRSNAGEIKIYNEALNAR